MESAAEQRSPLSALEDAQLLAFVAPMLQSVLLNTAERWLSVVLLFISSQ